MSIWIIFFLLIWRFIMTISEGQIFYFTNLKTIIEKHAYILSIARCFFIILDSWVFGNGSRFYFYYWFWLVFTYIIFHNPTFYCIYILSYGYNVLSYNALLLIESFSHQRHLCRMGYWNQWQTRCRKATNFGWVTFGWASCNIDTFVPLV